MASLKDLRNRISSIKNTQKITRAMKMVAAAKVKRCENATKASRPFTDELSCVFRRLMAAKVAFDVDKTEFSTNLFNYPELLKERELKTAGILIITSNKGLAGAYNANVIRAALRQIAEYNEKGIKSRVFVVGMRGVSILKRKAAAMNFEIVETYVKFPQEITFSMAQMVAEDLANDYVEKNIDNVEIFTTRFKNMMSYSVQDWQILPVVPPEIAEEHTAAVNPEMIYEPCINAILENIVSMVFSNVVYQAFREATASELAARMMAMSSATNNAEEMINRLTIDYNKVRQFAITQELLEIVSGADALKN